VYNYIFSYIECFIVRNSVLLYSARILSYGGAPKSISGVFPEGRKLISGNGWFSAGPGPPAAEFSSKLLTFILLKVAILLLAYIDNKFEASLLDNCYELSKFFVELFKFY